MRVPAQPEFTLFRWLVAQDQDDRNQFGDAADQDGEEKGDRNNNRCGRLAIDNCRYGGYLQRVCGRGGGDRLSLNLILVLG